MIEYKNFTNECGIYCFTNKINGKCYVGQGINLKKRLRSHYSAMKKHNVPNMIFYTAVDKYGIENFDLEILEFLDSTLELEELKKLLDEKEKFYIKEKNSYVPGGYNQTLGGDAGVLGYKMTEEQKEKIRIASQPQKELTKKHIWIRNISEQKYYSGYTYEEASKKSGVSRNIIKAICNKHYIHPYAKGWTFANDEITLFNNVTVALTEKAKGLYCQSSGKFKKGQVCIKSSISVFEYDKDLNLIKTYPTIKSLAEQLLMSPSTLTKRLHKEGIQCIDSRLFKLSKTKKTKNLTEEHKEKIKANCQTKKQVNKYTLNGVFIKTFDSITSAANSVNTDLKSIRNCCKGKAKTCKGFIWKFKDLNEI